MSPSPFMSNSMKNSEGGQYRSPGTSSPLRNPSRIRPDSEGGNTGTTARIKSAGVMSTSPEGVRTVAKYSKTFSSIADHVSLGNIMMIKIILMTLVCATSEMLVHNFKSFSIGNRQAQGSYLLRGALEPDSLFVIEEDSSPIRICNGKGLGRINIIEKRSTICKTIVYELVVVKNIQSASIEMDLANVTNPHLYKFSCLF